MMAYPVRSTPVAGTKKRRYISFKALVGGLQPVTSQPEACTEELRETLLRAAHDSDMPAPLGGALGGGWQWLWYASGSSEHIYRVDVSAELSSEGLTVSGHLLSWNRTGERRPTGETWYSRFYSYDEVSRKEFLDHLREKLKSAWDAATKASETSAAR